MGWSVELVDRFRRSNGTWAETAFGSAAREGQLVVQGTVLKGALLKLDKTVWLMS